MEADVDCIDDFIVAVCGWRISILLWKILRDIFVLLMIAAASFGAIVFSLVQSDIYHTLHYDNGAHYIRFVLAFLLGLAACCLLPSLPDSGWAYQRLPWRLHCFPIL